MTQGSGGSPTTLATLPALASCTGEHLLLHFPHLWENREGKEGVSYLHRQQSMSPRPPCEKGFFLRWRHLLVQPSGWHILLSIEAEVGAQRSGRTGFGRVLRGKHPSKVCLWHGQCCCLKGLLGPPEALPPQRPDASRSLTASG